MLIVAGFSAFAVFLGIASIGFLVLIVSFLSGELFGHGDIVGHDADFHGDVDNHIDVHHGYKGPMPKVGDKREDGKDPAARTDFKGNESRDGRGHVVKH